MTGNTAEKASPAAASAAEDHFQGDWAEGYDARVRSVIPAYEAMHNLVCVVLDRALADTANVLAVGSGTGTELARLGALHPGWRFTGIDPAPAMMAIARRRIADAGLQARVTLHEGALEELPPGEPFDAATLLLVLQFLPDDGTKLALLRGIAQRLKPGGALVMYDGHGDKASPEHRENMELWKAYAVHSGLDRQYVEDELKARRERVQFVTEERSLALLEEAGFGPVEPFCKAFHFDGWIAPRR